MDDELPIVHEILDIQKDEAVTGNPLEVPRMDPGHGRRGRMKPACGNIADAEDLIGKNPYLHGFPLDHDDPVEIGNPLFRKIEELLHVDDREDLAPDIDDAENIVRRTG